MRSPKAGECCDNVAMGLQIIPLSEVDAFVMEFEGKREWAAACLYADRLEQAERDARGNCGGCRHYDLNPDAGVRYFGHPEPNIGFCLLSGDCNQSRSIMGSGDWCRQFEARP